MIYTIIRRSRLYYASRHWDILGCPRWHVRHGYDACGELTNFVDTGTSEYQIGAVAVVGL